MSLQALVQKSTGQTPTKTISSKGLGKLVASSVPKQTAPPVAPQAQPDLLSRLAGGAQKVTDFLGLKGATDTIAQHIARATVKPELKQYLPAPSAGQNLGAGLEIGSLLLPATGVERIAGSVAEGALTKAALRGAAAGGQFGVLGGAGQALTATSKATDTDIAKESLKQGLIGAGGGALLGLGGALGGKDLAKLLSKSKPLEDVKIPPEEPPPGGTSGTVAPPAKLTPAEYAKKQGYEPITPTDQLPTIQMGPKGENELPTIQVKPGEIPSVQERSQVVKPQKLPPVKKGGRTTPAEKKILENPFPTKKLLSAAKPLVNGKVEPDLTYEPTKQSGGASVAPEIASTVTRVDKTLPTAPNVSKPTIRGSGLKDIKSPTIKPSKVASDINSKLVKQGFDQLPPDELSHFNSITKEEQINKVGSLIGSDLEKAQRMAIGQEKIPNDVHPQVLFNAVKNKAIQDGDGEILRSLASSPISKQRSLAAQSLGASGFNNGEVDAVKAISDINKAREDRITRTYKNSDALRKELPKQAKTELKRAAPTKQTVADFIQTLTC